MVLSRSAKAFSKSPAFMVSGLAYILPIRAASSSSGVAFLMDSIKSLFTVTESLIPPDTGTRRLTLSGVSTSTVQFL